MRVSAESASNLALIKYMGKKEDHQLTPSGKRFSKNKDLSFLSKEDKDLLFFKNQALNPSLSLRLDHLKSFVTLEEADEDSVQTLAGFTLSSNSKKRFLLFFKFLKRLFKIEGNYLILSKNNFPQGIGAASSASSFCCLVKASFELAKKKSSIDPTNWKCRGSVFH